jgi:hypothetical protein
MIDIETSSSSNVKPAEFVLVRERILIPNSGSWTRGGGTYPDPRKRRIVFLVSARAMKPAAIIRGSFGLRPILPVEYGNRRRSPPAVALMQPRS